MTTGTSKQDFRERLRRVADTKASASPHAADLTSGATRPGRSRVFPILAIGALLVLAAFLVLPIVGGSKTTAVAANRTPVEPVELGALETRTFERPAFDIDLPVSWKEMSEDALRAVDDDGVHGETGRSLVTAFSHEIAGTRGELGLFVSRHRNRDATVTDAATLHEDGVGLMNFLSWFGLPAYEIVEGPTLSKLDGFETASVVTRQHLERGPYINRFIYIDTGYELLELFFMWPEGALAPADIDRIIGSIDVK